MGSVKLLKASAGSGKTYRLAYEYIRSVIEEPMRYRHILAVTFTNKATEEMKRRILAELDNLARGTDGGYMGAICSDLGMEMKTVMERASLARTKILHDYGRFAVLTIDKFFQRIIRSFLKELGLDLDFSLELKTESLISAAADMVADGITADGELKKWVTDFVQEKIEENQAWDIKTGLAKLGREIFKEDFGRMSAVQRSKEQLAGIVAELSGKASAAVDIMKADASRALGIMEKHSLCPGDFRYGSSGFANYFVKTARGEIAPYGSRVKDALESDEGWYSKSSGAKKKIMDAIPELKPLLQKICSDCDDNLRFLESYKLVRKTWRNFGMLADLSRKVGELCRSGNILPISETNPIIDKLVSGNDAPFIFEKAGSYYSQFMMDEFQDTSSLQWQNFLPLLRNALAQSAQSPVLIVGDVKQAIYRWRGGDWKILLSGIESSLGNAGEVIPEELNTNYRSLKRIVDFNNELTGRCLAAANENLNRRLDDALTEEVIDDEVYGRFRDMLVAAYEGYAQIPAKKDDAGYASVTVYGCGEEEKPQPPVIRCIEQLQDRGYTPGDIAVLVRRNKDGVRIADMLLEHKSRCGGSGYGYDFVTWEALPIGNSPVAGFIISVFRAACSDGDSLNLAVYNRWLGRPLTQQPDDTEAAFLESLCRMPPLEAFEKTVLKYGLNGEERNTAYLQALEKQLISFQGSRIGDIPLFLEWWEETGKWQSVDVPKTDSAITIITIHKAKGLEFKAVIIPYCDWQLDPSGKTVVWTRENELLEGLCPIPLHYSKAMRESYFSEEYFAETVMSHIDNFNTFYVAATRAVEELHIMIPRSVKNRDGYIDGLILGSISEEGDKAFLGDMTGKVAAGDDTVTYGFGVPLRNGAAAGSAEETVFLPFRIYSPDERLRLRLQSERYTENGASAPFDPRELGILMHKAFETAEKESDIIGEVDYMLRNGRITPQEADGLKSMICTAFSNELVNDWFGGQWETVRNESDIIMPLSSPHRRPDRVMTRGKDAVVVDYKFGLRRSASYRRKIEEYAGILRGMGYENVKGYLWYVSLDDIEPVV